MTFFNTISDKRTTVSESSFNGVNKISALGERENVLDSEWKLTAYSEVPNFLCGVVITRYCPQAS